ncbi:NYN domain protein [uncultured archaeon]|nr:NYN domain protein [uncultured archaeon]
MIISSGGSSISYRSFMIFIDGGYLRKGIKEKFGHDKIDFNGLPWILANKARWGTIQMELRRVYYYDAITDYKEDQEKHKELEPYFENIQKIDNYEVKLGRLIKTNKENGYRQKGVDVLLAIDMISKAHLDHYDIALLLAGDDDYLDMVKSIKDFTGKRVYGAYFEHNASKRLVASLDMRIPLTEDIINQIVQK